MLPNTNIEWDMKIWLWFLACMEDEWQHIWLWFLHSTLDFSLNIVMHSLEQVQNWFEEERIVQMCNSLTSNDNIWHPTVMIFITVLLPAFTSWTEVHRSSKCTLLGNKVFIQIKNLSWRPTKEVYEIFLDSLFAN